MKRGDRIQVRTYPDRIVDRVVLEVHPTYVLACRPEVYDEVKLEEGLPARAMGFPLEDLMWIEFTERSN